MSAGTRTGTDPLYWPCGYCRAERGNPCRALTGTGYPCPTHSDRLKSVELFTRYGGRLDPKQ